MDEMDLEENIAVVAVGGHARVVQHLTNDLTMVREAIGEYKPTVLYITRSTLALVDKTSRPFII